MAEWITVTTAEELGPGQREVFEIEEYYIAIFNVDGTYYAIEDLCSHDDEPLADGEWDGFSVACPRHGARFDIRTGEALSTPATRAVKRFETRVADGSVQILFEDDDYY